MRTHTQETQLSLTPLLALEILKKGNDRFVENLKANRNLLQQVNETSAGQFPFAVILSCIDSRTSAELVFDQGLGDIFSVRIAGNIVNEDILGSMEFACAVAGSKLVVVMGHTSCGAVNAAVDLFVSGQTAAQATGCGNLDGLVAEIQLSIDRCTCKPAEQWLPGEKKTYSNEVSRRNVLRTIRVIRERSSALDRLVREGKIAIVGGHYDVGTGQVTFFRTPESSLAELDLPLMPTV